MCAFRPCISFTPKNTRHRSPTDLCNAVENQAAGLFFIYRFVLSLQEGRLVAASQRRAFPNFNSRPCERGDWPSPAPQPARAYFNSRPCERGDHPPPRGRPAVKISIHAPARGATIKEYQQAIELPISIHAPARGATSFSVFSAICDSISIHAPARGATQGPPQGGQGQTLISIHAPARGATSAGDQERCPGADFNSRPCERGDALLDKMLNRRRIFQFTPLREGRLGCR